MRIFVDVEAHYGETLDVALDPRWGFDRVYSLEPSSHCQRLLRQFRDPRLVLDDRGLSDRDDDAPLYGAGLLGGSIYADKPQGSHGEVEVVQLVRASSWLRERTTPDDEIFLKLNCEGSEVDVLGDLLESDVMGRVRSVYVDFDVRKIPSQAHRQAGVEAALNAAGVSYFVQAELEVAGNPAVRRWLEGELIPTPTPFSSRARHALRLYLPPYLLAKAVARAVLPRRAFLWAGERYGRRGRGKP